VAPGRAGRKPLGEGTKVLLQGARARLTDVDKRIAAQQQRQGYSPVNSPVINELMEQRLRLIRELKEYDQYESESEPAPSSPSRRPGDEDEETETWTEGDYSISGPRAGYQAH